MPNLRELEATMLFDSSTDEVERQFLIPALERSIRYDRGVGFFTSNWLRRVAMGLVGLAENGGRARIIASPKLSPDDWAALRQGVDAQSNPAILGALKLTIEQLKVDLKRDTLAALAWMIADELLEFRIATPSGDLDGDFHDKFGQFHDAQGNVVAFHGSPNDSERAFHNYESISCYYSWIGDREQKRVTDDVLRFERLWTNRDRNVRVFLLPEAIRRNLVEFTDRSNRPYRAPAKRGATKTDKWRHQAEAVNLFIEKTNGILAMATGTGKTRTALAILDELKARSAIRTAIVTMSGNDLMDQWRKELLKRRPFPLYCAYGDYKDQQQFVNDPDGALLLVSRQNLPGVLARLPPGTADHSIIVCDEVHGIGSHASVTNLSGKLKPFKYRLGLSATPDREYDPEGNAFIDAEIGPIIYEFGLQDAIERGILCELDYVALPYTLSDDDRQEIRAAIKAHHARRAAGENPSIEDLWRRIASVRKSTLTKLPPFIEYIREHPEVLRRCLVFVDNREFGLNVHEQITAITGRVHSYYAEDHQVHLEAFSSGGIECLITCHRISEGIDIKSVNNVILFASSRSKLETIQRLGRCLRTDEMNPSKRALVLDFVEDVDAPEGDDDEGMSADQERRAWFEELAKVKHKELT